MSTARRRLLLTPTTPPTPTPHAILTHIVSHSNCFDSFIIKRQAAFRYLRIQPRCVRPLAIALLGLAHQGSACAAGEEMKKMNNF